MCASDCFSHTGKAPTHMALSCEWAKATVELIGETEGDSERGREKGGWRMSRREADRGR